MRCEPLLTAALRYVCRVPPLAQPQVLFVTDIPDGQSLNEVSAGACAHHRPPLHPVSICPP